MEGPRILLLDIETAPLVVYSWGVYEENAIEIQHDWYILSFSAKWLNGEHITKGLCDYKSHENKDSKLVAELWRLLDKADAVVAHNGKSFDLKKITARFIVHGLKPPSPYMIVDTRLEAKRIAGFASNKLDWLGAQLHLGRKVTHEGFALWLGCMNNDQRAWKKMKRYNRHDVVLLEKLYRLLAPYIRNPNNALFLQKTVCANPVCGSRNLRKNGFARTMAQTYQRIVCVDCGKQMRLPMAEKETKTLRAL